MQACPELPVWAALASGNLEQVVLSPEVKRVVSCRHSTELGTACRG
jgi:hypothetical protein